MEPASFTFVNTTNTPGLSHQAAKLMRGHVTKINFANRRQRKAEARAAEIASTRAKAEWKDQNEESGISITLPLLPTVSDPFPRFWSLSYYDSRGFHSATSPRERFWFDLFFAEPALIEASVAIGEKNWSPNVASKRRAEVHLSIAVNTVIQRIQSRQAQTDGVLAAVITLAFGERLARNDTAWNIHIDGLAQIIRERYAQGIFDMPLWFLDLQVFDSVNEIFGFPRMYHKKITEALGNHAGPALARVVSISDRVIQLRRSIDAYRNPRLSTSSMATDIEESLAALCREARDLQADDNPNVQAASRSIELVIRLSWPPQPGVDQDQDLARLANELKEAWCRFPIRPCAYMELTSYQFMIGAIAASQGSPTRVWYVTRLKGLVHGMQMRGWEEPLEALEGGFASDLVLLKGFKSLRKELMS
ncbi:hypothetical protein SLS62_000592 [Diatrype stigma]|uniref:Uncharacterized protein n=1 Tax=Diatrype stigma TaxID=117547 RepID=A0AAN9YWU7_9PEZI